MLIDAENVRRSHWPNLSREELVRRARAWSGATGRPILIVFDGRAPEKAGDVVSAGGTADDWLAGHAPEHVPYWLVTSDRALRRRVGEDADRVIGGGSFVRELLASDSGLAQS